MISVIIPSYNAEKTLEKCLTAVKESVFKDYELIVVDDASQDRTNAIAGKYANSIVKLPQNRGLVVARKAGWDAAKSDIIVSIDSDVVIKPDALQIIADYFDKNSEVSAVTGLLSKECPCAGFFSQYKNLYMNYIFRKLPRRVSFLYGSIFAIRRDVKDLYDSMVFNAEDTGFGQKLVALGKIISFLNTLEVIHLKEHDCFLIIKNDFSIPFNWAKIFLERKGWQQLFSAGTGFAHASKAQIASVLLAPLILLCFIFHLLLAAFLILIIWSFLSFGLLYFIFKEKGAWFGIRSVLWTYFDHIVMFSGICCGFVTVILSYKTSERNKKCAY